LQQPETGVVILERLVSVVAEHLHTAQQQIVHLLSSEIEYNEN